MGAESGRRSRRLPVRIPAALILGRREHEMVTEDISAAGMRLRTEEPPPERRLVQVRLVVPPDGQVLVLNGVTSYVVRPGGPRAAGFGLQLYGNPPHVVTRWQRFFEHARGVLGECSGSRVVVQALAVTDSGRRRFERVRVVLEVRVPDVDALLPLATTDVSRGGLFLVTDTLPEIGDELGLEVVHPQSGERFALRAVVRRTVDERELGKGIGVEFVGFDDGRREEFWDFVAGGLPTLGDEDVMPLEEQPAEVVEFVIDFE